jgi:hypothetical protein
VDTGGDVPAADPAASSRPLFFPPAALAVFDGDGFILQVHGVFTRIHSGATAVAIYGGALGFTLHSAAAACADCYFWPRSVRNVYNCAGWKTLRVLASIYKSKQPSNSRMDKSALG